MSTHRPDPARPSPPRRRGVGPIRRIRRIHPWPLAIIIFFLFVFLINGLIIYLAYTNDDPIVESYDTTRR